MQKAFDKQVRLLAANRYHPSFCAKKYDESRDLWQARVNRDWRFYFTIISDTYRIEDVIPHPKSAARRAIRHYSLEVLGQAL